MFGELTNPKNKTLTDLNAREIAIMVPLVVMIFVMGLYPKPFIDRMAPSIDRMIEITKVKKQVAVLAPTAIPAPASVSQEPPAGLPAGHPALPTVK
jgi:NADH-quinone oxidoreductase subunit M